MAAEVRRTPLDSIALFAALTVPQRRQVELLGRRQWVRRGNALFRETKPALGFHVLLSGRLKAVRHLSAGNEILMHYVEAGDLFGEVPALMELPYTVSAVAEVDSEVFTIPVSALQRLISREPEIGLLFMRNMARKMAMLLQRIEMQKAGSAEQRVARWILSQRKPSSSATVQIPGTKKALAAELGLQPETLSRALAQMKASKAISTNGRVIKIENNSMLEKFAIS